jgi:ectonucleotide pyrophosphatase/phosphodiesterase family protein 5
MKSKLLLLLFILVNFFYAQSQPYVILVSFDGFRWDYSERGITPNLDKMKKEGVHALSLRPSFPTKTFPNHYSIVTGMYPENHGIIFNSFINPITKEKYRLGDSLAVRNSEWYLGEAFWQTAERNGIKTASFFWPGSEVTLDYRRPTYYEKYEHNKPYLERIDGVINWLELPQEDCPHFITLYFHDTDSYGHKYGPNSPEINQSIQRLDTLINYLNNKLLEIGMKDSTNIIIVSDHGMTEISEERTINIEEMLNNYNVRIDGSKPLMMIEPEKESFQEVYNLLKDNEFHYKTYLKEEMPHHYHFSQHPFISPILLVADVGWSLVNNFWLKGMQNNYSKGNHGYDNNHTDMHGVFIAKGPSFKENYKIGTILNVDINPLLCKIFGISPRTNIDGKLERIEFILTEN